MTATPAEAERAVLGAALLASDPATTILDALSADDFADPACRAVFEAIRGVAESGAPPDPVLVADEMRRRGNLDRVGGAAGLHSMMEAAPVASLTEYHVAIVKDAAARRRLLGEAEAMRARAADLTKPLDGAPAPRGLYRLLNPADVEPVAVEWVWEDRIAAGTLTMSAGPGGVGKGAKMVDLVARVTRGDLAGDLLGTPSAALWLSAEERVADVIGPRLRAAGANLDLVRILTMRDREGFERDATFPDDLGALREAIDETGARLVVVDPLNAHLADRIDSHKDAPLRRALGPLTRVAGDTRAAVVGIAHVNKGAGDAVNRVIGSVAYVNAARSVLIVGRPPDADETSSERVVAMPKANLSTPVPSLRFRLVGREIDGRLPDGSEGRLEVVAVEWLGEDHATADDLLSSSEDRTALGEAVDFLRELLEPGPMPRAEIVRAARSADIRERTLQRARKHLRIIVERDESKQGRPATWRLPPYVPTPDGTKPDGTKHRSEKPASDKGFSEPGPGYVPSPGDGTKPPNRVDEMPSCGRCGTPATAFDRDGSPLCEVHRAEAVVVAGFNGETLDPDAARRVIEAPGVRKVDEAGGQVDEIGDPFAPTLFDEVGT